MNNSSAETRSDSCSMDDGSQSCGSSAPDGGTGTTTTTAGAGGVAVCTNPDDLLEPLERLEKYATSEIAFHRQVATRSILDTLHEVRHNENDVRRTVDVIARFACDVDSAVKMELLEQIPHIASYFVNQVNPLSHVFFSIILPFFEQYLMETNAQIRKVTQNALIVMVEQGFLNREYMEEKLHGVLVRSLCINSDDVRIEALTTISKIIRFFGKESTERLFLGYFARLCSDGSFNIRRVCASNFGEFCTVVGQEVTEEVLLPHFELLCEDGVWGVRKACADVFVPVSCVCSSDARRNVLAPLFVKLLCDHSRWVKTAAFQALGPFISTFADPSKTGLYYNDGGVIAVDDVKDHESNDSGCSEDSGDGSSSPDVDDCEVKKLNSNIGTLSLTGQQLDFSDFIPGSCTALYDDMRLTLHVDNESAFNNFQYWRIPIPEIEVDVDIEHGKATNVHVRAKVHDEQHTIYSSNVSVKVQHSQQQTSSDVSSKPAVDVQSLCYSTISKEGGTQNENCSSETSTHQLLVSDSLGNPTKLDTNVLPMEEVENVWVPPNTKIAPECSKKSRPGLKLTLNNNKMEPEKKPLKQNIIPQDLLGHYLSMINPLNFQIVDPELSHHCAYSLPAVALTLGRKYWPCLKETYEILASDMQWKVRWTLASSLHQMSLILGPEYTSRDLLPVFLSFMKDLDEVRFGILQNLSSILELLNRDEQLGILPKISEFLKMDNDRNWRFRWTLAHQLISVAKLYNAVEVKQHLIPIALSLIHDKISEVRLSAIRVFSTLIKRVFCDRDASGKPNDIQLILISELKSCLYCSPKWVLRQSFALLCERVVLDASMPVEDFKNEMLDCLLNLANDPVANVRLVLARVLANTICKEELLMSLENVQTTVQVLMKDKDHDVQRYLEPFVNPAVDSATKNDETALLE